MCRVEINLIGFCLQRYKRLAWPAAYGVIYFALKGPGIITAAGNTGQNTRACDCGFLQKGSSIRQAKLYKLFCARPAGVKCKATGRQQAAGKLRQSGACSGFKPVRGRSQKQFIFGTAKLIRR